MDVEVFSLLPQGQRNGCNLACQREAHHGGLDAFGERALVKLLNGPGFTLARVAAPLNRPFRSWL
jgi:hypothetical protein